MNSQRTLSRALLVVVVGLFTLMTRYGVAPASAAVDCTKKSGTCIDTGDGSVVIDRVDRRPGTEARDETNATGRRPRVKIVDQTAAFCADATANAAAAGGAPQPIVDICAPLGPLPVAPGREQVLTAFRELPLYHGAIRTDPAVFTLVNLETYFWCGDADGRGCEAIGEAERQVTLLGQPVRIRPKILSYQWRFGDGTSQRADPGRTAHTYRRPGHVTVTLTLTWTADYALGTGSFQPIDDTTTTTSPSRVLPVREAQTVIVGGG